MSTDVATVFEIKGWDESPIDEDDGARKVTRARVTRSLADGIDGTSLAELLMAYAPDGSASIVGVERVRGAVGERRGSFVLQQVGRYADGVARCSLTIVPGSGTDDLASLTGQGEFYAESGMTGTITLALEFAEQSAGDAASRAQ